MSGCGTDVTSSSTNQGSAAASTDAAPATSAAVAPPASPPAPPPSNPAAAANAVTLSWDAPTENADGSALVDLHGYKVHYGTQSHVYSDTIEVANPGLTTYVVQNLPAGKHYFAITAYNTAGSESAMSEEVSTQVD